MAPHEHLGDAHLRLADPVLPLPALVRALPPRLHARPGDPLRRRRRGRARHELPRVHAHVREPLAVRGDRVPRVRDDRARAAPLRGDVTQPARLARAPRGLLHERVRRARVPLALRSCVDLRRSRSALVPCSGAARRASLAFARSAGLSNVPLVMYFHWTAYGNPFTPGHQMLETARFAAEHHKGLWGILWPTWDHIQGARGRSRLRLLRDEPVHVARSHRRSRSSSSRREATRHGGAPFARATIVWARLHGDCALRRERGLRRVARRLDRRAALPRRVRAVLRVRRGARARAHSPIASRARRALVAGHRRRASRSRASLTIGTVGLVYDTLPETMRGRSRSSPIPMALDGLRPASRRRVVRLDVDDALVHRLRRDARSRRSSPGCGRRRRVAAATRSACAVLRRRARASGWRPRSSKPEDDSRRSSCCIPARAGFAPGWEPPGTRSHHAPAQRGRALRPAAAVPLVSPRRSRARARRRRARGEGRRAGRGRPPLQVPAHVLLSFRATGCARPRRSANTTDVSLCRPRRATRPRPRTAGARRARPADRAP